MATNRYTQLLAWMDDHFISFVDVGKQLEMSASGVRMLCLRDTMPAHRHAQFVRLGFPERLLPEPCDLKRGPKNRAPIFPGLQTGADHQAQQ